MVLGAVVILVLVLGAIVVIVVVLVVVLVVVVKMVVFGVAIAVVVIVIAIMLDFMSFMFVFSTREEKGGYAMHAYMFDYVDDHTRLGLPFLYSSTSSCVNLFRHANDRNIPCAKIV